MDSGCRVTLWLWIWTDVSNRNQKYSFISHRMKSELAHDSTPRLLNHWNKKQTCYFFCIKLKVRSTLWSGQCRYWILKLNYSTHSWIEKQLASSEKVSSGVCFDMWYAADKPWLDDLFNYNNADPYAEWTQTLCHTCMYTSFHIHKWFNGDDGMGVETTTVKCLKCPYIHL